MQDLRFTNAKCPHDVTSVKEVSEKGLNEMGGSQQEMLLARLNSYLVIAWTNLN